GSADGTIIPAIIAVHVTMNADSDPRPMPISIPVIRRTEIAHAAATSTSSAARVVVLPVLSLITGKDATGGRDSSVPCSCCATQCGTTSTSIGKYCGAPPSGGGPPITSPSAG